MEKLKRFVFEHKKAIAVFGVLVCATVLLCVPFTLEYAVKVFGWAVWFYLAVGIAAEILICLKKQINLTTRSAVFLVLATFFSLATLHVAFMNRAFAETFTDYIVGSYESGTVGGAVLGIITSPFAVWFTYIGALVFFMVCAALFFFLFFRPFIFEGTRNPISDGRKRKRPVKHPVCHEILLDDAPFMKKNSVTVRQTPSPLAFMVAEEEKAEKREENPRDLLFGGEKEEFGYTDNKGEFSDGDVYGVTRYDPSLLCNEQQEKDPNDLLFGKDDRAEESVLNYGEEEEDSVLFDNEEDDSMIDLLRPNKESSFYQALRGQPTERFAPGPIVYSENEDTFVANETPVAPVAPKAHERPATAPSPAVAPTSARPGDIPISTEYVYYNNTLIPVVRGAGAPAAPAQSAQPMRAAPTQNVNVSLGQYSFAQQQAQSAQPQGFGARRFVSSQSPEEPEEVPGPDYFKSSRLVIRPDVPYSKPPLTLLENYVKEDRNPEPENLAELVDIFENRLQNFNVEAHFVKAIKGPTVTLCLIDLGEKCPVARLNSARTDLQRWLRSPKPITIISQVENTGLCGVEIPNAVKEVVGFKEILSSKEYLEAKGDLVVALGKTARGEILVDDLAAMPHALVAGETGSGKSVCLNVIISSLIYRYSPEEVKLVLIDLKQVEMAPYAGLPHMLLKEPLLTIPEIVNVLKWIREEVVARFALFKSLRLRSLNEYNSREGVEKLPRIVIIIDEASELMSDANAKKTLESTLNSLARIARAAGVHLIFATQNPIKSVITSEIQNNLPVKIAFAVTDYVHSMVIFKQKGAECLLGRGDMYIKKTQDLVRAQCAYISTPEIESMVNYVKEFNEYAFNEEEIQEILNGNATSQAEEKKPVAPAGARAAAQTRDAAPAQAQGNDAEEVVENETDLMWKALKIIVDSQYVSCSYLQRKLRKGYNTVMNILEKLQDEHYISAVPQGSKDKRNILISKEDFYAEWEARYGVDEDHELENFDQGEPLPQESKDEDDIDPTVMDDDDI